MLVRPGEVPQRLEILCGERAQVRPRLKLDAVPFLAGLGASECAAAQVRGRQASPVVIPLH